VQNTKAELIAKTGNTLSNF